MIRLMGLIACVGMFLISGCSGGNQHEDLHSFMTEVKAKPSGEVDPLPTFRSYKTFSYGAMAMRSPFDPPLVLAATDSVSGENKVQPPDENRKKEYLENYNFAALSMVGALSKTRPKPGQSHPATRSFQAIRIAVNDELGQLVEGLSAAERALRPGGQLAVVTFHSIEDRIAKRFLQARSGGGGRANRYAPEVEEDAPQFKLTPRKAIGPDAEELEQNPRARSARLRVAQRTDAPAGTPDMAALGLPKLLSERGR